MMLLGCLHGSMHTSEQECGQIVCAALIKYRTLCRELGIHSHSQEADEFVEEPGCGNDDCLSAPSWTIVNSERLPEEELRRNFQQLLEVTSLDLLRGYTLPFLFTTTFNSPEACPLLVPKLEPLSPAETQVTRDG